MSILHRQTGEERRILTSALSCSSRHRYSTHTRIHIDIHVHVIQVVWPRGPAVAVPHFMHGLALCDAYMTIRHMLSREWERPEEERRLLTRRASSSAVYKIGPSCCMAFASATRQRLGPASSMYVM